MRLEEFRQGDRFRTPDLLNGWRNAIASLELSGIVAEVAPQMREMLQRFRWETGLSYILQPLFIADLNILDGPVEQSTQMLRDVTDSDDCADHRKDCSGLML